MIDDTQVSKDLDGLDNIDSFWDSARLGALVLREKGRRRSRRGILLIFAVCACACRCVFCLVSRRTLLRCGLVRHITVPSLMPENIAGSVPCAPATRAVLRRNTVRRLLQAWLNTPRRPLLIARKKLTNSWPPVPDF